MRSADLGSEYARAVVVLWPGWVQSSLGQALMFNKHFSDDCGVVGPSLLQ